MKKSVILTGLAALLVLAAGIGGYVYMTAPTKGPSQNTPPPMGDKKPPTPLAEPEPVTAEPVTTTKGQTAYTIVSERSTATFTLDEMLRGEPKTVVGTSTGAIAGEIGLDKKNPSASTLGTIKLNARTFVTDDKGRNNMIRRSILKTEDDANEFITFKPTSIVLVPTGEQPIDSLIFTMDILGDLTMAGVTKPTVFRAKADVGMDGTMIVHAATTVKRSDFNIVIPSLPFLANIEENVDLALDIVAQPKP